MTKPTLDRARVLSGKQCHYCGADTVLVDSSVVYGPGKDFGKVWQCQPCDAYVGCHGDTDRSKGSVANKMLRMLRKRAHAAFDPLWKDGGPMSRDTAYAELSKHLKTPIDETHIGMFDSEQCQVTERWAHVAQAIFRKPKPNEAETMNTITATILSIEQSALVPAKAAGTLGTQWWVMRMSDRPEYDLFIATNEGTKLPFEKGQQISYTEGKTSGGKPKLIPQASAPVARQATPPPAQGGVSPQLQQQPPAPAKPEQPEQAAAPQRPDNEVRKAKVSRVTFIETFRDGQTHKYGVAMDNGDKGVIFMQEKKDPFIVGEDVSYTLSGFSTSGKPYAGGEKRIDVAVTNADGSATTKDQFLTNIACLNSAMTFIELRNKTMLKQYGEDGMPIKDVFDIANEIKKFATTNK